MATSANISTKDQGSGGGIPVADPSALSLSKIPANISVMDEENSGKRLAANSPAAVLSSLKTAVCIRPREQECNSCNEPAQHADFSPSSSEKPALTCLQELKSNMSVQSATRELSSHEKNAIISPPELNSDGGNFHDCFGQAVSSEKVSQWSAGPVLQNYDDKKMSKEQSDRSPQSPRLASGENKNLSKEVVPQSPASQSTEGLGTALPADSGNGCNSTEVPGRPAQHPPASSEAARRNAVRKLISRLFESSSDEDEESVLLGTAVCPILVDCDSDMENPHSRPQLLPSSTVGLRGKEQEDSGRPSSIFSLDISLFSAFLVSVNLRYVSRKTLL
jgi:hypothetical protein